MPPRKRMLPKVAVLRKHRFTGLENPHQFEVAYVGEERRRASKPRRITPDRRQTGLKDVALKGGVWRKYDPKKYPRDSRIPAWVVEESHNGIVHTGILGDGIELYFRHIPGEGYYFYTTRRRNTKDRRSSDKKITARIK